MELIHKRTYGEHLELGGAIEHFFDSFPEEWGELVDDEIKGEDNLEGVYESIAVMGNGLKVKVEIYCSNDSEEEDTWFCEAYKIS